MLDIKLIEELTSLDGVSGDEEAVRNYIIEKIKDKCDYEVDRMGNLICHKKGAETPKNKLMISAHMDEVGFIVTYIENSGLLKFDSVGGIDPRVVIGKNVRIKGINGETVHGVIGTKAVHMQTEEERENSLKISDLFIDIGATKKEDAENLVALGERVAFDGEFFEFGDGFILAKALDDRIGCYLLLKLIEKDLPYDCNFVFTTNEEAGVQGAETAAYTVSPDNAIIVEATTAADIPDVPANKTVCTLKNGPVFSFMDRATIYNTELYKKALATAERENIPCQSKEGVFGGNEARSVQCAKDGAKVLALSLPCRYIHSQACVLAKSDIENSEKILEKLISEFAK